MFISDETVRDYLAMAVLLTFPVLGIIWGTWGFFWEVLMLLAVFLVGRRRGPLLTLIILVLGYSVPLSVYGVTAFAQMSYVPVAGLVGVLGGYKQWPVRVTFFWGAALAAVLGAIPTMSFLSMGIDAQTANNFINVTIKQYQEAGLLTAMQQQGITEVEFRSLIQQAVYFYILIVPGLAAIIAALEFSFVFYGLRRWLKDGEARIPFTRWRLPWYAVWGAVLGISFYLIGDQFSWNVLRGLGINLMVVYGALTLVLGTSVYLYLLQSPKIPRFLKFALVITSFFYFFFSVITIILFGLFDLVFNFRRLPDEA